MSAKKGAPDGRGAHHVVPTAPIVPEIVTDDIGAWWTDPALAYWAGLQDGARMALERRYLADIERHRAAVAERPRDRWVAARRDAS